MRRRPPTGYERLPRLRALEPADLPRHLLGMTRMQLIALPAGHRVCPYAKPLGQLRLRQAQTLAA